MQQFDVAASNPASAPFTSHRLRNPAGDFDDSSRPVATARGDIDAFAPLTSPFAKCRNLALQVLSRRRGSARHRWSEERESPLTSKGALLSLERDAPRSCPCMRQSQTTSAFVAIDHREATAGLRGLPALSLQKNPPIDAALWARPAQGRTWSVCARTRLLSGTYEAGWTIGSALIQALRRALPGRAFLSGLPRDLIETPILREQRAAVFQAAKTMGHRAFALDIEDFHHRAE